MHADSQHILVHPLVSRDIAAIVFGFQRGFPHDLLPVVAALRAHNRARRPYTSLAAWEATVPPVLRRWLTRVDVAAFEHLHGLNGSLFSGAMNDLASVGRRDLMEWLHRCDGQQDPCSPAALDCAASAGHFDCVQFLTLDRTEAATSEAMDQAAANGFGAIVRFLHQHRREGCTNRALDKAAQAGHLDIVQYLVDHVRDGCCLSTALDVAAASGHMDVVAWLHPRTPPYRSTAAVDGAAAAGDLAMVDFLLAHREEGASGAAIESAVVLGRMDLLQRLLADDSADCNFDRAMVAAVERRHVEAVTLLTPRITNWRPVMHNAATRGDADLHLAVRFVLACHVDAPTADAVGVAALCEAAVTTCGPMATMAAIATDAQIEQACRQLHAANEKAAMARLKPLRQQWWRWGPSTRWPR